MEIAAGLSWAVGNQELTAAAAAEVGQMNFDANGGFAKSMLGPDLSGLASLELLKLVTNEDGFEKCAPTLADSSING